MITIPHRISMIVASCDAPHVERLCGRITVKTMELYSLYGS